MENRHLAPHADMYTKAFEDRVKEPIEYLQFLSWIKELIAITEAQNQSFNSSYIDLFFIRIYGLFDIFSKPNSVSTRTDSYTLHVKQCIAEMYDAMTDDEYLNLVYWRHCAAHPLQGFYDLFDDKGKRKDALKPIRLRGVEKLISVEDIDKTIHRVFCDHYNNGTSFDKLILQKLSPFIMKLKDGWYDRHRALMSELGVDLDNPIYQAMM